MGVGGTFATLFGATDALVAFSAGLEALVRTVLGLATAAFRGADVPFEDLALDAFILDGCLEFRFP
jgi:hypothetical protein